MTLRQLLAPFDRLDLPTDGHHPRTPGALPAVVAGFLLIWVGRRVVAAWPFSTDDAYISLRYARHWAAGQGLLWNIGEPPVEGYSNFLSVALATLGIRSGLDPMLLLKSLGVLSLLASCYLLWLHARRWTSPLLACAAPLLLVAQTGSVWWGVSGMETTLYLALGLLAVLLFLDGWGHGDQPVSNQKLALAGIAAFLAAITRPEGLLVGAVLGFSALVSIRSDQQRGRATTPRKIRGLAWFALPLALLFAVYTAWRLSYYGRLFPNPVYCKVNSAVTDLRLLRDYAAIAWPLVVASLPMLRPRRFDSRVLPFLMTAGLYAAILRNADSVIGYHHRHVLLAYAMLCVVAVAGLGVGLRWTADRLKIGKAGAEAAAMVLLIALVAIASPNSVADLEADAETYADRMRARAEVAAWLRERLPPDQLYATPDAGLIPYLTPHPVLDTLCLNCAAVTRAPISFDHERYAAYILSARPRFIVAVADDAHEIRTGWAMRILKRTREFRDLYSEVAFFETTTADFNLAIYETKTAHGR